MTIDTRVFTRGDAIRWAMVLVILVPDFVWLMASGRAVTHGSLVSHCLAVATLAVISLVLSLIAGLPRITTTSRGLHYRRLALVAQCGALLVAFTSVTCVLSYLFVTLAPPLVDARLAALDAMLGFDWPRAYVWVRAHSTLHLVLLLAYSSGLLQLVLLPMLIGLLGRAAYLREFLSNLMLSSVLLLLIAAPWPAAGAFVFFGVASPADIATVSHFSALREGSMRVFDLAQMQGLVSLPSYHTAMALFFVQAMRWTRPGVVIIGLLNLLMIVSTPTEGGHYLVDVVAGVGLWVLTAGALRLLAGREAPARAEPAAAPQPV